MLKTQRKLINALLGALLLFNSGLCAYAEGGHKAKVKSLEDQIAACIHYPQALKNIKAGIVAVSFRVDSANRITEVQSHSGILELDRYLMGALWGKKLKLSGQVQPEQYLVRIRFHAGT